VDGEVRLGSVAGARREQHILLGALAWATAVIHVIAAAHHYREWVLYGVFFTVLAPAQAIWGGLVIQHPENRRLLLAGGAANLLVALVWAMSRTTGIPVGPASWQPEAVGWHDVMATLNELAIAGIVAGLLGWLPISEERFARGVRAVAVGLIAVSVIAASLAHEHG
jgi:hypothetical protein